MDLKIHSSKSGSMTASQTLRAEEVSIVVAVEVQSKAALVQGVLRSVESKKIYVASCSTLTRVC